MIVDNRSVVDSLQRMMDNTFTLPKYAWKQWLEVVEELSTGRHTVDWCPSHDKKKGKWKPREPLEEVLGEEIECPHR